MGIGGGVTYFSGLEIIFTVLNDFWNGVDAGGMAEQG